MAGGGDDRVNAQALTLTPGARLVYDGELVEVVELDGARVVVRNARTAGFTSVKLGRLAAGARSADSPAAPREPLPPGVAWNGLTGAQRAAVSERAAHVREVLTGYRAGHAGAAVPGEPRPEYEPGRPLKARYRAKAKELGVSERTVERWAVAYRDSGEAGLVDARLLRGRHTIPMMLTSTPTRSRSSNDQLALQPVTQGRLAPLRGGTRAGAP
jgi:Helix-turn-helix domain